MYYHREPTQSVCVADCYFIVNVLNLPFASPIALTMYINQTLIYIPDIPVSSPGKKEIEEIEKD